MNARDVERDQKAQAKAIARKPKAITITKTEEQQYHLRLKKDRAKLDACDDSPNLASELLLVRQLIQRSITDNADPKLILPWIKLEESVARSIIAMGGQLALLIPHATLFDAARVYTAAVDEAMAVHAPERKAEAVEWLKKKLGALLLEDAEQTNAISLPPAKQHYKLPGKKVPPASPNLSLGGSIRLLRFYIQEALTAGDVDFCLMLVKQLQNTATTQLSLAKIEGVLVSTDASRRMIQSMTDIASLCISRFAPADFNQIIDDVGARITGRAQQEYEI